MSIINVLNSLNDIWDDKGDTMVTYVPVPGISQGQITVDVEGVGLRIHGENREFGLKVNKTLSIPTGTTNPRFRYEYGLLVFSVDKILIPRRRLDPVPAVNAIGCCPN